MNRHHVSFQHDAQPWRRRFRVDSECTFMNWRKVIHGFFKYCQTVGGRQYAQRPPSSSPDPRGVTGLHFPSSPSPCPSPSCPPRPALRPRERERDREKRYYVPALSLSFPFLFLYFSLFSFLFFLISARCRLFRRRTGARLARPSPRWPLCSSRSRPRTARCAASNRPRAGTSSPPACREVNGPTDQWMIH